MTLRFLLDENISPRVCDAALRHHPHLDIVCVGEPDCPPIGASDESILEHVAKTRRILVTKNRRSMPGHVKVLEARGGVEWSVFRVRAGTTYRQLIDTLVLFNEASQSEEWLGVMEWIPY